MHQEYEPPDETIRGLLSEARLVAVLGASARRDRPSFEVPDYLARHGYHVVAVNPRYAGDELHGHLAVGSLAEIERPVDIVDVFRRAEDLSAHLEEILALRPLPGAVWLQLGIRHDGIAQRLRSSGIQVIQDRCLKIEHRRLLRFPPTT